MKKLIIHCIPIAISFTWLVVQCQTYNPIVLQGPEFLKFYLILVLGSYVSILCLKSLGEKLSPTNFYFLILIGGLGMIKLIRGIMLGKPIGFLTMILLVQFFAIIILTAFYAKPEPQK